MKFTKNKTPNEVVSYKIIPFFLSFNQKMKLSKIPKRRIWASMPLGTANLQFVLNENYNCQSIRRRKQ